jgi:type I restriction enzyme, S subunit
MKVFPESWTILPANKVCSEIVDCLNKTAPVVTHDTGFRMIRTTNIRNGVVDISDTRFVEEVVFRKWTRRARPNLGDIILTREAPLGEVGILRSNANVFLGQRTILYRADPQKLDQHFLYYQMSGPYVKGIIHSKGSGSTVEHLRVPDAETLPIPVAPLKVQKKIAAILSTYDELIENNKRRIALLEKLAEEIYREWFVRLRFPGHKSVSVSKAIPEGWKMIKVGQAFEYRGGGTPSKSVERYWQNGGIDWFTPSDITSADGIFLEQSDEQCTDEGYNNSSAKLFPPYSVMLTSRATIGAIGINTTPACTNQGFITCIPNERYPLSYLYHWLKLAKPHFELLAGGATFAELTKGTFKNIDILTPPEGVMTQFTHIESPLFKKIETLLAANRKLVETRELLLPRLISGKLPVENLDIQFPPGMLEELDKTSDRTNHA